LDNNNLKGITTPGMEAFLAKASPINTSKAHLSGPLQRGPVVF